MRKIFLLVIGLLLVQPDLLLAKGNKQNEDGASSQERGERGPGHKRKDHQDKKRQERQYSGDRQEENRSTGSRYQQEQDQGGTRGGQPLPPGLAKKAAAGKPLPPGWQAKLTPGQPLDPNLRQYSTPVAGDILSLLPKTAMGTTLLQLEDKVVRVNNATQTILEVLDLPAKTRR